MSQFTEQDYENFYGEFIAWQIVEHTWVISYQQGHNYVFLLEGDEKAILIDTAFGYGNLRGLVEKLTDKPVIVVNTHWHADHIGGNGEWEEVYASKGVAIDAPFCTIMQQMLPYPIDYAAMPYPQYQIHTLHDGELIELGGRTVEVMEAKPSHSHSDLMFLDKTNRLLFCGDLLEPGESGRVQMGLYALLPASKEGLCSLRERLENMRDNTLRMKERSGEFDLLLANHNGCPMAKSYMDDFIGLCDGVLDGSIRPDALNGSMYDATDIAAMMTCLQYKKASIYVARSEYEQMIKEQ